MIFSTYAGELRSDVFTRRFLYKFSQCSNYSEIINNGIINNGMALNLLEICYRNIV